MKVCGLIAIRDFGDPSSRIKAQRGDALPKTTFAVAKRLIKSGYVVRRRYWKLTGEKHNG